MDIKLQIQELEQNVWDERFFPLLKNKINCLESAIEKIIEYEKEYGKNERLEEVLSIANQKLLKYKIDFKKPFEIQLQENKVALEKEYDEARKDIIRTRMMNNYISMKDFDKAYAVGMELLSWCHVDVWWLMNVLIEQKAIVGNKIKEVQDLYFEHLTKFKDNSYLWNSLMEVFMLAPEQISIGYVDEIFQMSHSDGVKKANVNWNDMGRVYFEKRAFTKAIDSYLEAVEQLRPSNKNYSKHLAIYYGNISEAYTQLKEFDTAIAYANKGIEMEFDNKTLIELKLTALCKNLQSDTAKEFKDEICKDFPHMRERLEEVMKEHKCR